MGAHPRCLLCCVSMSTSQTIRKVVFPAAGLGTRILPATAVLTKELLPIVDQQIIQYGVELLNICAIETSVSSGIAAFTVYTSNPNGGVSSPASMAMMPTMANAMGS